jgi:hypothetical protein
MVESLSFNLAFKLPLKHREGKCFGEFGVPGPIDRSNTVFSARPNNGLPSGTLLKMADRESSPEVPTTRTKEPQRGRRNEVGMNKNPFTEGGTHVPALDEKVLAKTHGIMME